MKSRLVVWIAAALLAQAPPVWAEDAPGSDDHPLISRYPGAVIAWYDTQAFVEFRLPIGPETGYRQIDDWLDLEGRLTRIYYVLEGEKTLSDVYANYRRALDKAEFTVLATKLFTDNNVSKEVGGGGWLVTAYGKRMPASAGISLIKGSATKGGTCYIAAKLERPEGDVYVALAGSQYTQDQVVYLVDILEVQAVEGDLVTVDADAMSKSLDQYGKVALYGIFFEFDRAEIKPESEPALKEIAKLLKRRPQLELYVVGHTDIEGTLDYNLKLSEQRAAAVVEALTGRHGIASGRLAPRGVGPLAPVMTNQADAGRAKNRRVELVER